MNRNNPYAAACSFLETIVPCQKLRELCKKYDIKADEGTTYKKLLDKVILQRAANGDKTAAEFVKEYNLSD